MDYILVFLSSLLLAIYLAANKYFLSRYGNGISQRTIFIFLISLFSAFLFFAVLCGKVAWQPFSSCMALLSAVFITSYTLLGFVMMQNGMMAAYSLFLMSGGMVVPYFWGAFRSTFQGDQNETVTFFNIVGLVMILSGVVLFNFKKGEKGKAKYFLCGVAIFFFNGFVSVISKIHQSTTAFPTVSTAQFSFLNSCFRTILCVLILTVACKTKKIALSQMKETVSVKSVGFLFVTSICFAASGYCLLRGAVHLPATILYPISTGGTIVLSVLAEQLLFKEKLSVKMITGVLLCFLGTCVFCLR